MAAFLSLEFGTRGPAYVHSSACASGAKAMASAARLLGMGLADAVITGGVDSLCAFTVAGFSSLNLVSATRCNPFSANRDGINIGEAAALFLMTREPATVRLLGWGESSDGGASLLRPIPRAAVPRWRSRRRSRAPIVPPVTWNM